MSSRAWHDLQHGQIDQLLTRASSTRMVEYRMFLSPSAAKVQSDQVSVDELNAVLEGTPFLRPYGFSVRSCAEGECVLHVAFAPELERPGGIVSGMTLMGAADVAMWLAIMTKRGTDEHWVTSDMKTAFLRSGRQEDFMCTARILKIGKRSAYGTAECNGVASGLLTHHVLTYVRAAE